MIKPVLLVIGTWGALVYLITLEFEMLTALTYGRAILIPDFFLPLEALIIVPFIVAIAGYVWFSYARITLKRDKKG